MLKKTTPAQDSRYRSPLVVPRKKQRKTDCGQSPHPSSVGHRCWQCVTCAGPCRHTSCAHATSDSGSRKGSVESGSFELSTKGEPSQRNYPGIPHQRHLRQESEMSHCGTKTTGTVKRKICYDDIAPVSLLPAPLTGTAPTWPLRSDSSELDSVAESYASHRSRRHSDQR